MNTWGMVILIIVLALGETLIAIAIIRATVGRTFKTLAGDFPAIEPDQDAIVRRFQSFRFGLINAGFSVHVSADAKYLHLQPARFLRWFGARAVSIPWESISLGKKSGRSRHAMIGTLNLIGPAWALDLAEPEQQ